MLKRHIQIRQHQAFDHQRNQVIDVRVWIDVMQAYPHSEITQRPGKIRNMSPYWQAQPEVGLVTQIDTIGAGVL